MRRGETTLISVDFDDALLVAIRLLAMTLPRAFCALAVIGLLLATLPSLATPEPICVGDCNHSHTVTVDEILTMVNIALSGGDANLCDAGDANRDKNITVDEVLTAVNAALFGCAPTPTPPPTGSVERGLEQLRAADLRKADGEFATASSSDGTAELYALFTHLTRVVLDDPQLRGLAQRAGISITGDAGNICDIGMTVPDTLDLGAPRTQEVLDTARSVLLPELEASLVTLSRLPDSITVEFPLNSLPRCVVARVVCDDPSDPVLCADPTFDDPAVVRVDRSDVAFIIAGLHAAVAGFETVTAYDVNVPLQAVLDGLPRAAIDAAPGLLSSRFADRLGTARTCIDQSLAALGRAIDLMGDGERTNHLMEFLLGDFTQVRQAKLMFSLVRQSLSGDVALPVDVVTGEVVLMDIGLLEQEHLNLDPLFSGSFSTLRTFLPSFDVDGHFDAAGFPDPTFGGTLPTMTNDKINHFFDGGPPCAACSNDVDCDPFGLAAFSCESCVGSTDCPAAGGQCTDPSVFPPQCGAGGTP